MEGHTKDVSEASGLSRRTPESESLLGAVPRAASVGAILVGCLVLLGWELDVDILKRVVPGLNAMNPASAIAFILAGVSLWLLRNGTGDRRRLRIARGCAFAVALITLGVNYPSRI